MTTPTGDWQVPPGYGQAQWGAYPPHGYQPVYLVPRPPRPGVVRLAVILTYVGVAVAALDLAVTLAGTWLSRNERANPFDPGRSGGTSRSGAGTGFWAFAAVAVVLGFVLPAAGAVVAAIFSARGANPGRIVLASLMGLYALVNLCQAGGQLASIAAGSAWMLLGAGLQLINLGLAVTIGALLLVPAANQYFTPGPGRRFATNATPVPSTYDRP